MSQNLKMDPVKKDYVLDKGSPIPSDRIEEAAYFALTIPQDKWTYSEPGQGSLLYTLAGQKRDSSVEQKFASYAKDAINRQLIATGQATDSAIQNTESSNGATKNNIKIVPAQTQLSDQLEFVPV
jgi:phage gp46-like protein